MKKTIIISSIILVFVVIILLYFRLRKTTTVTTEVGEMGIEDVSNNVSELYGLDNEATKNVATIANAFQKHGDGDNRKLAYIIATAKHESRFKPVRECFASDDRAARHCVRNRSYGVDVGGNVYYGRGFVQLTWENNYKKMSDRLGVDLVAYPDAALGAEIAAEILVIGMLEGLFTRKRLDKYINDTSTDYYNARRVVNGTDRAGLVKGHAQDIEAAISIA